jgi:hypothetical protein
MKGMSFSYLDPFLIAFLSFVFSVLYMSLWLTLNSHGLAARSFLQCLSAQLLLPVALVDGQFKRLVVRLRRHAPDVRVAAVADNHVFYEEVQDAVERRGADQDSPRQPPVVIERRQRRRHRRREQDGHAELVREVFLLIQLVAATQGTGRQRRIDFGRGVEQVIAFRTLPIGVAGQPKRPRAVTDGTGKADIHTQPIAQEGKNES